MNQDLYNFIDLYLLSSQFTAKSFNPFKTKWSVFALPIIPSFICCFPFSKIYSLSGISLKMSLQLIRIKNSIFGIYQYLAFLRRVMLYFGRFQNSSSLNTLCQSCSRKIPMCLYKYIYGSFLLWLSLQHLIAQASLPTKPHHPELLRINITLLLNGIYFTFLCLFHLQVISLILTNVNVLSFW